MFTKFNLNKNDILKTYEHTPSLMAKKLPFHLFHCGHFCCSDDYYTERKGLKNFLLIFTLEGKGIIQYRDLELEATRNTCFLINCDEYQYYKTAPNCTWEFYFIHFSGVCAKEYFEIINENCFNLITIQNNRYFSEIFEETFQYSQQNTEQIDLKLSLNITKIITALTEEKQTSINHSFAKHREEIHKTREYLEQNFASEISVSALSKSVNLSKYYFIKLFNELIGQTPYEYLIGVRINNSKKLLKETDLSISEIAYFVGFNDVNNYIIAFKKLTGTTPLKFKLHWVI